MFDAGSQEHFEKTYEGRRPVILTEITTSRSVSEATTKERLLADWGGLRSTMMNPDGCVVRTKRTLWNFGLRFVGVHGPLFLGMLMPLWRGVN
jgi:hypothetical protein